VGSFYSVPAGAVADSHVLRIICVVALIGKGSGGMDAWGSFLSRCTEYFGPQSLANMQLVKRFLGSPSLFMSGFRSPKSRFEFHPSSPRMEGGSELFSGYVLCLS